MVEPLGFGANPDTAGDNAFQETAVEKPAEVEREARREFRALRAALESRGIEVVTFTPNGIPSPDAVFPNNWFSTHPSGSWALYPMMAPSRRQERSPTIVEWLRERYGEAVDWTAEEASSRFLEGTGSVVVDESTRVVYASTSSRTSAELVEKWAERFGYRPVVFTARDRDGRVVYHTNVVLTLGTGYAIACTSAIEPPGAQSRLLEELARSGRIVIEIELDQLHAFCANALELENTEGKRFLVMSERAWRAFTEDQRALLENLVDVVKVDLETIETYGGGSARCMLAELY
jgi:hypothetical protein